MRPLRFVFDRHGNGRALRQLQTRGVDVVHVADVGLSEADDPEIFVWAVDGARIIVTRNCQDFAPLVSAYDRRGLGFPGALFYAMSVSRADPGATPARGQKKSAPGYPWRRPLRLALLPAGS